MYCSFLAADARFLWQTRYEVGLKAQNTERKCLCKKIGCNSPKNNTEVISLILMKLIGLINASQYE